MHKGSTSSISVKLCDATTAHRFARGRCAPHFSKVRFRPAGVHTTALQRSLMKLRRTMKPTQFRSFRFWRRPATPPRVRSSGSAIFGGDVSLSLGGLLDGRQPSSNRLCERPICLTPSAFLVKTRCFHLRAEVRRNSGSSWLKNRCRNSQRCVQTLETSAVSRPRFETEDCPTSFSSLTHPLTSVTITAAVSLVCLNDKLTFSAGD